MHQSKVEASYLQTFQSSSVLFAANNSSGLPPHWTWPQGHTSVSEGACYRLQAEYSRISVHATFDAICMLWDTWWNNSVSLTEWKFWISLVMFTRWTLLKYCQGYCYRLQLWLSQIDVTSLSAHFCCANISDLYSPELCATQWTLATTSPTIECWQICQTWMMVLWMWVQLARRPSQFCLSNTSTGRHSRGTKTLWCCVRVAHERIQWEDASVEKTVESVGAGRWSCAAES